MVSLCLGILVVITVINLRGGKESGAVFALPTLRVRCDPFRGNRRRGV